jgi:hypothetical protein
MLVFVFVFVFCSNMYKILGEDKVMVDKLAPERLEAEYSLVSPQHMTGVH